MKKIICPKCRDNGVKNSAGGKEFYYCRTCKEEITEDGYMIGKSEVKMTEKDVNDLLEFFKQNSGSGYEYEDIDTDELDDDVSNKWGMCWGS